MRPIPLGTRGAFVLTVTSAHLACLTRALPVSANSNAQQCRRRKVLPTHSGKLFPVHRCLNPRVGGRLNSGKPGAERTEVEILGGGQAKWEPVVTAVGIKLD
jgi:hypothetical protein